MPRRHDSEGSPSSEEVRQRIQRWLMQEGWRIGEGSVPQEARWVITGQDPGGRHIVVAQRVDREDQVLINGAVNISESHRKQLEGRSEADRANFLFDLSRALLSTELEFEYQGVPLPHRIVLAQRIYYDALSKDAFLLRVSQVRKGVILVILLFQKQFQEIPPTRELGFRAG